MSEGRKSTPDGDKAKRQKTSSSPVVVAELAASQGVASSSSPTPGSLARGILPQPVGGSTYRKAFAVAQAKVSEVRFLFLCFFFFTTQLLLI